MDFLKYFLSRATLIQMIGVGVFVVFVVTALAAIAFMCYQSNVLLIIALLLIGSTAVIYGSSTIGDFYSAYVSEKK